MYELNAFEIICVSGGTKKKESEPKGGTPEPKSGTLTRPTAGESEYGRVFNDIAGALNSFGSWLGCTAYDVINGSKQHK